MSKVSPGAPEPREELEFFRGKSLARPEDRHDWRDMERTMHARSFVVAKAEADETLRALQAGMEAALKEGWSVERLQKTMRPRLEALGWWGKHMRRDPLTGELKLVQLGSLRRLRVIYDANMRAAYAAGQWARIQRLKARAPWLLYIQIDRPSKRPAHARYNGLLRPVDDPVWRRIFPPNGWRCACRVRQLTDEEVQRRGLTPTPPEDLETFEWVNERTGEVQRIPLGVDPGWDTNSGALWLDIEAAHTTAAAGLAPELRAVERGLAVEIRARGLRDGEESLALYDLETGAPIDWARGDAGKVSATATMAEAMRDPGRRVAAVHNHPSSRAFSASDLALLMRAPGLEATVVVGHDGSIYRAVARGAQESDAIRGVFRDVLRLLEAAAAQGRLKAEEIDAIWPQIACLVGADFGFCAFSSSLSPRMMHMLETHRALIDEIRAAFGGRRG